MVEWEKHTPEIGKYFRIGFGGHEKCKCEDCLLQRHSDLEILEY